MSYIDDQNNIVFLSTSVLHQHPDNPRKELGDLEELAESIKARGIMQNLTVVPHKELPGNYTVIIGHRRLGAAKVAGINSVPCVITTMSDKEQLATMMLENMQRSDLTIREQADGFQLMMNLGENVESISKKTGLSKSTVRNRLKLTRFDKDLMREAETRQPTMEQYLKLSEIEDDKVANDVLRFIGTKNFDNEVAKAIRVQKEKKEREEIRKLIGSKAEKLEDASYPAIQERKLVSVKTFYSPYTEKMGEELDDLRAKYGKVYYSEGYGFIIYRDRCEEDDIRADKVAEVRDLRNDLEHRADYMFDSILKRAEEFVSTYKGRKGDFETIMTFLFECLVEGRLDYQGASAYRIAASLGFELAEGVQSWEESARDDAKVYILDSYDADQCATALKYLLETQRRKKPFHFAYRDTKLTHQGYNFNGFLGILSKLGYNVAEEEWEFLDGTHPIYTETVPV